MSRSVYQYRVWCSTDNKYEYVWGESSPTVCPSNNSHTIDANLTTVVDTVSTNEVLAQIVEEDGPVKTGGHYQGSTFGFDVDTENPGDWHESYFSFPIPISLLSLSFSTNTGHTGDSIELIVFDEFHYGTHIGGGASIQSITSDVTAGDTVINVDATSLGVLKVGYFVKLDDGSNKDDLGRVLSIDTGAGTITVENAAVNNFAAATPTKLLRSVKMGYMYELSEPNRYVLGQSKIGGSYIPAGTPFKFRYRNLNALPKRFVFDVEYLY